MKFATIIIAALAVMPALGDDVDCNKATTQIDLDMCANKDYGAADKLLNDTYKKVVAAQEGDTAKLKAAQRAWIAFRDAECTFEVAENEGGTIYPMVYTMCLTKLTKTRTAELNSYLACQKDATNC